MRTKNPITVLGPDGRPLAGAAVHTVIRSSGIDASVYAGETGATPGANPATTDATGKVTQWLERGAYTSTATAVGMDPSIEPWDSAPASDGAIDDAWIPDQRVVARMVNAALKPSGTAAAGDEALRAIGATAGSVVAGNDSRLCAAIATRQVLDVGLANQIRAGRVLSTVADFINLLRASGSMNLWNLSDMTDASGNGRALTNKGAVTIGPGIMGAAAEAAVFAGSTAQVLYSVDAGGLDPLRIRTGSWGCWLRTAKRSTSQRAISKLTAAGAGYVLGVDGTSNAARVVISSSGTGFPLVGASDIADDRWHFVIATADGTVLSLYVDGVLEGVMAAGLIDANAAPLNIGGYAADGATATTDPFFGRVDEAFISWGDVLTADQVRLLYCAEIPHGYAVTPKRASLAVRRSQKGAALVTGDFPATPVRLYNLQGGLLTDAGSGGVALTNNNGAVPASGPEGAGSSAMSFLPASSQWLNSSDAGLPSGTAARSYGLWFKTRGVGVSCGMIGWGNASIPAHALLGVMNTGSLYTLSGGAQITGPNVSDGAWHLAIVVEDNAPADGLKRKLYLDGRCVAVDTVLSAISLGGAISFRIAVDPTGAFFAGQLARAFVYAGALTPAQIATLYAKGTTAFPPSPKDTGSHVEAFDATNVYAVFDTLGSEDQVDLLVAA